MVVRSDLFESSDSARFLDAYAASTPLALASSFETVLDKPQNHKTTKPQRGPDARLRIIAFEARETQAVIAARKQHPGSSLS